MNTPPPIPGSGLRRRLPVFLSALVYPGTGQIAQGKWMIGIFFMVAFSGFIFPALYILVSAAFTNIQTLINYDLQKELVQPPVGKIILLLGGTILTYLVNIWDTWHRSSHKVKSERSMPPTPR